MFTLNTNRNREPLPFKNQVTINCFNILRILVKNVFCADMVLSILVDSE